jgi:hypothetical protein
LSRCIDECFNCAKVCIVCADADLAEDSVAHMRRYITLCGNCADICEATARVASRTTEFDRETARALLEACITSCRICGAECEHHANMGMKHCVSARRLAGNARRPAAPSSPSFRAEASARTRLPNGTGYEGVRYVE